jgi:hypothetical protein
MMRSAEGACYSPEPHMRRNVPFQNIKDKRTTIFSTERDPRGNVASRWILDSMRRQSFGCRSVECLPG